MCGPQQVWKGLYRGLSSSHKGSGQFEAGLKGDAIWKGLYFQKHADTDSARNVERGAGPARVPRARCHPENLVRLLMRHG
ncbi:hypothetical protein F442_10638 [Phytophthora nicotianae P10297]|uniref:Uncharacterized protein n=1 Tax=Phytophthora nicotianae P10297 TaxID=1317064 RepID=W2Z4Z8_PHYNI|nr:hypothetical protein F442_10638 [Phytophthora nicotianae P10297]